MKDIGELLKDTPSTEEDRQEGASGQDSPECSSKKRTFRVGDHHRGSPTGGGRGARTETLAASREAPMVMFME